MKKLSFNTVGELREALSAIKDDVPIAILDMQGASVWRFKNLNCSLTNIRNEWFVLLCVGGEKAEIPDQ